jgi:hypothetical protein
VTHQNFRRNPAVPIPGKDAAKASVVDVVASKDVLDGVGAVGVGAVESAVVVDRNRVVENSIDDYVEIQSYDGLGRRRWRHSGRTLASSSQGRGFEKEGLMTFREKFHLLYPILIISENILSLSQLKGE